MDNFKKSELALWKYKGELGVFSYCVIDLFV